MIRTFQLQDCSSFMGDSMFGLVVPAKKEI
jgi:hypothetical protein